MNTKLPLQRHKLLCATTQHSDYGMNWIFQTAERKELKVTAINGPGDRHNWPLRQELHCTCPCSKRSNGFLLMETDAPSRGLISRRAASPLMDTSFHTLSQAPSLPSHTPLLSSSKKPVSFLRWAFNEFCFLFCFKLLNFSQLLSSRGKCHTESPWSKEKWHPCSSAAALKVLNNLLHM